MYRTGLEYAVPFVQKMLYIVRRFGDSQSLFKRNGVGGRAFTFGRVELGRVSPEASDIVNPSLLDFYQPEIRFDKER